MKQEVSMAGKELWIFLNMQKNDKFMCKNIHHANSILILSVSMSGKLLCEGT
jgi:hypothetical protein